jgi:PAS domain S-box-containing protein
VEKELYDESNNLQNIIENSDAAIWLCDRNTRLITYNKIFEHWVSNLKGISPSNSMNLINEVKAVDEEIANDLESYINAVVLHHKGFSFDKYYGKGLDVHVELSYRPVIDNGEVVAISCFARDITENKRLENELIEAKSNAEKASEAKSNFLSTISHELRTPLNAILGITQVMEGEKDEGNEDHEHLKIIHQSASQLLTLINDILDHSKIESGEITFENDIFNSQEILEQVDHVFSPKFKEKGIDLILNASQEVPQYLKGDRNRLLQILNNLVTNGLKFTNKGYVKLMLNLVEKKEKGLKVQFIVEDSGIGIPEEKKEEIFDAFKQVENNVSRNYEGTGLGLSITKKLVQKQGGKIWLESQEGAGTTFFVEIPFEMGEEDAYEGAEDSRISEIENSNGGLEKALLVEDNLMNRKVATKLLKQINVSAKEAESGEEALSLMAEEGFDIVLLDIHMPDMNGFEVAKAIRQNSNRVAASKVPIVAISADIYNETKDKAHQAGIDDFIEKPIDINKLQDAIKRIGKQMG